MPKVLGGGFIVMSHALDNAGHNCNIAHPGRVAGDDQGVRDRPLRDGALDDRQRLLGRLARPAAGRQRLPRRLPGDHAAVLLHRRLVVGDAVRGVLLRLLQYFEDPSRWGPGVVYDPVAISAFLDHPNSANPVTFTTVIPNSGDPIAVVPGRARPTRSTTRRRTRTGVRCTLQDYMVNVVRHATETASPAAASATSASSTGSRACATGLISPRSSSTSTRASAAPTST